MLLKMTWIVIIDDNNQGARILTIDSAVLFYILFLYKLIFLQDHFVCFFNDNSKNHFLPQSSQRIKHKDHQNQMDVILCFSLR